MPFVLWLHYYAAIVMLLKNKAFIWFVEVPERLSLAQLIYVYEVVSHTLSLVF